ncbi:MAG: helix-hairpin-helix domain-containing protein, partial [Oscillospiraceae bacterium]|nr:helix-hairpin-helix domain-containing protein [Oscillospiraceae bacterium]
MYQKYGLKRVFYSAYIPSVSDALLPAGDFKPPLLREHRLYQADWLLRQYGFSVDEILSEDAPDFNPFLDPKCNWAINHPEFFPIDVNTASKEDLMRVPGIGFISSRRIVTARRSARLCIDDLKRIGVVLKRARYFILAADQPRGVLLSREHAAAALMDSQAFSFGTQQMSLFSPELAALSPREVKREAISQIAEAI